jgi:hypothetical protein
VHSITTPYAASNEAAKHCPTQGSREATPSSRKETSSDIAIHSAQEALGWQEEVQAACPRARDHDDGNDKKAGGSGGGHIVTISHSNKCHARPPTDHFKRLIEEACTNHAYPVRHKLKDYGKMKSS